MYVYVKEPKRKESGSRMYVMGNDLALTMRETSDFLETHLEGLR